MRRLQVLARVAIWCLLAPALLAQTPSPSPAQPPATPPTSTQPPASTQPPVDPQLPTFRTGADLVRVDVSVIDRKGLPVANLTPEDFVVEEDGVQQSIQSFKFISVSGHPEADDEISLPIRSRDHARAEAARDDVRVFLIFWDEYHINRMTSAIRAREFLTRFVRTSFGPKDLVAIMDPLTTLDSIRFTRDRLELAEQVRTLRGRLGEYAPPRSGVEEAHLRAMRDIERLRSEVSMSALKAAAVHLGSLRDGRKSLIVISEGMRGLGRDVNTITTDLVQSANASNTAIFTVNPLGLTMRRMAAFEMLEAIASETGAEFSSSNDPGSWLTRIVTQASAYYLLGYASQRPLDGKFHKIKVRVRRDGLEVRARSGYWAPSVADMTRARKASAEAELPPEVARANSELAPAQSRRTVDIWTGVGLGADGRPEVRVAWTPRPTSAGNARAVPASVSIVAVAEGVPCFDGPVDTGGTVFGAPPGPLKVTASVFDATGELIDRDTRTVAVHDFAAASLSIGSPTVLKSGTYLEFRELRSRESPPAFAGREFARTDRLLIRFALYGSSAEAADVSATLLTRRGDRLSELPVARLEGTSSRFEIDLPLQTIARGDFLVAITASRTPDRVETMVPLRIVR